MKKLLLNISKGTAIAVAFVLTIPLFLPVQAFAQFGGIVHDPINYGVMLKVWHSDVSTYAKLVQEVQILSNTLHNAQQMYALSRAMSQQIAHPQRMNWVTMALQGVNVYTTNRYGETVNWSQLINGQPSMAQQTWNTSTLPLKAVDFLSKEQHGSSPLLASLASVEAQDSSAVQCLSTISQYRQTSQSNTQAFNTLQALVLNDTATINSEIGQLNQVNGQQSQAINEARSQNQLQSCLVEQQVLANKTQRDQQAEYLNFLGKVDSENASLSKSWFDPATLDNFRLQ